MSATTKNEELVVGLVGAVGVDFRSVIDFLTQEFSKVGFVTNEIRLSKLLHLFDRNGALRLLDEGPEHSRINGYMDAGNEFRKESGRGDAIAILAMKSMLDFRTENERSSSNRGVAHVLNSLKHPSEVESLQKVYGERFVCLSIYAPVKQRTELLTGRIAKSCGDYATKNYAYRARKLISRDQKEKDEPLGQSVGETFPLADFFVDATSIDQLRSQIERIIKILFSHPFVTPTRDEHLMFHARAAGRRSADLSRQVGAVIATSNGEILTEGCNEVPTAGGGSFWESLAEDDGFDNRDFRLGYDSTVRMKFEILTEIFRKLKKERWLSEACQKESALALAKKSLDRADGALRDSRVSSIIEFGRIVHAEMSAIVEAARRGVSIKGASLVCTTFPCHMCARHIIAAGIQRVLYIEPYPKSMASDLYHPVISVDGDASALEKSVRFEQFMGVSPSRYFSLFEMPTKRKSPDGRAVSWHPLTAPLKLPENGFKSDLEKAYISDWSKGKFADKLRSFGLGASDGKRS